jgi:hypothetical protein
MIFQLGSARAVTDLIQQVSGSRKDAVNRPPPLGVGGVGNELLPASMEMRDKRLGAVFGQIERLGWCM